MGYKRAWLKREWKWTVSSVVVVVSKKTMSVSTKQQDVTYTTPIMSTREPLLNTIDSDELDTFPTKPQAPAPLATTQSEAESGTRPFIAVVPD